MKKQLTLCIPIKDGKVLLGMKKRGFGAGRWNGFGGKLEAGETIVEGALREVDEEVGIKSGQLTRVGILDFSFQEDEKLMEVHVFKLTDFVEVPVETEEMRPEWFAFDEIPFSLMWPDDEYWMPLFLQDKLFQGSFLFDKPSDAEYTSKILEQKLEEVDILDENSVL